MDRTLAELSGIILGDGHIHTKHNLITIVGGLEDLEYYNKRVNPLFYELFNQKGKIRRRKDRNAYYLMIYSKSIFNVFLNVGLSRGSKINAKVPEIILQDKKLATNFIRGLFDTDGCLKFSKQTKDINYYPRVQIALRKSQLAEELVQLFRLLNFPYGCWQDTKSGLIYYQISGRLNVKKWFKEISPQNPVHVSKYQFWKMFGYYIPKSTLKYRKRKLKTKIL